MLTQYINNLSKEYETGSATEPSYKGLKKENLRDNMSNLENVSDDM